jgi:hypothetical protein
MFVITKICGMDLIIVIMPWSPGVHVLCEVDTEAKATAEHQAYNATWKF